VRAAKRGPMPGFVTPVITVLREPVKLEELRASLR
jgi:hypothetical protein